MKSITSCISERSNIRIPDHQLDALFNPLRPYAKFLLERQKIFSGLKFSLGTFSCHVASLIHLGKCDVTETPWQM